MPSSVKSMWFMISVSLSEMLLDELAETEPEGSWENSLQSILKYIAFWRKADQTYYLSHLLLPNGTSDLSTLGIDAVTGENQAVTELIALYKSSEAEVSLCSSDKPEDNAALSLKEVVQSDTILATAEIETTTQESSQNDEENCDKVMGTDINTLKELNGQDTNEKV